LQGPLPPEQVLRMVEQPYYWWTPLLLFLLVGLSFALSMLGIAGETHVRERRRVLRFLLAPWAPRRMLVVGSRTYYDDEFNVFEDGRETHITTQWGEHYVYRGSLDDIVQPVEPFDARGPIGRPGPFSMFWRWTVFAVFTMSGALTALMYAYMDKRVAILQALEALGYTVPARIALQVENSRETNIVIASIIAGLAVAWAIGNLLRLRARSILLYRFIPVATSGTTIVLVPAPVPGEEHRSVRAVARFLADGLVVRVDESVRPIVEALERKTGESRGLIAMLLNMASFADLWRRTIGARDKEYKDMALAIEESLKYRGVGGVRSGMRMLAVGAVIGLLVGGIVGLALGVLVGHPTVQHVNQTSGATGGEAYSYYNNTGIVHPAQPPPPPGGGGGPAPPQPTGYTPG